MSAVDTLAVHLALRNRARSLVVCTTGSTNLSATATGYHRAAGSFETDNFEIGMEITPAGFAANTVDTLIGITASDLTTKNARAVEAVAGSRSISVGLPLLRSFENNPTFTPVVGRPYYDEDFIDGTKFLLGSKDAGEVESMGQYKAKWYGLPGTGISALRRSVDKLAALFAPGTQLTAGDNYVRILGERGSGPYTGQIIPLAKHAVLILTIPWRVRARSVVIA